MSETKLVAFLGMPGSGKTEAVDYFEKKYRWPKVYFGQVTLDEVRRQGLEVNEKNERMVREGLREQFGEDYYAREVIKKIDALAGEPFILLESLYSWTEYKVLKERFGDDLVTIGVYASPKVRHSRLAHRPLRPLTPKEALDRDMAQLEKLVQGNPLALADFMLINEDDMDHFHKHLDEIAQLLIMNNETTL